MVMFFVIKDEERRKAAIEAIRLMPLRKPMSVEIKEYRKNRSTAQNRLYWSWVNIIADFTGETPEDLHEAFKQRLLGTVKRTIMGEECILARTTTTLSTAEFTGYLERVEDVAEKLQLRLPRPDDYWLAMHGGGNDGTDNRVS